MKKLLAIAVFLGAFGVTSAAVSEARADGFATRDASLHLALEDSSPKKDETVSESPDKITLWFTQAPQMSGTSIRLLPKGGEPLDLGDAEAMDDDDTVVVLAIGHTLAAGDYEVHWRAMAQDGHVIRGDFGFTVGMGR